MPRSTSSPRVREGDRRAGQPGNDGPRAGAARVVSKKKTIAPSERDRPSVEQARAAFIAEVEGIDPSHLVFLDESGSHISMTRDYARAPIGLRAHGRVPRNRGRVLTIFGALALDGRFLSLHPWGRRKRFLTRAHSSAPPNGLVRRSSAPALRASILAWGPSNAVIIRIGMSLVAGLPLILVATS
jgi:hypothetical protein